LILVRFIDFVLAMEHKGTPQALTYHFKCLDYMHKGYLTVSDINYWYFSLSSHFFSAREEKYRKESVINTFQYRFRDITAKLHYANLDLIPVEDVRDEASFYFYLFSLLLDLIFYLTKIFDMICPADPYHITLNDIIKSGTGMTYSHLYNIFIIVLFIYLL